MRGRVKRQMESISHDKRRPNLFDRNGLTLRLGGANTVIIKEFNILQQIPLISSESLNLLLSPYTI